MPYVHLTPGEREVIAHLAASGESFGSIAGVLERHKATISREIRRNSIDLGGGQGRVYIGFEAVNIARDRQRGRKRELKLDDEGLRERIEKRLKETWSPEQISKVLKGEGVEVSHETIYAHVQRDFFAGGQLYRGLRRRHRLRRKRCVRHASRIVGRVSIHDRPREVEDRLELGHWEGDTVVGHGGRIVTLVERASRYLVAIKVRDGRSSTVIGAIKRRMRRLPGELLGTLTTDNGSEFAGHAELTRRLGMAVYFADPHSPWQRGTNENTNGLLRQFVPKSSDFSALSRQRLAQAVRLLNNRPRKVLNYQTPVAALRKPPGNLRAVALQT